MTVYRMDARDPLVIRDGRPNDGRSESRTLSFPLPSTLAGAVRTALGRRNGAFDGSLVPSLLADVSIRGPLLAVRTELLVPAPGDALLLTSDDDTLRISSLAPISLPSGAVTADIGSGRLLVGLAAGAVPKAKPHSHAPRFWTWAAYEEWLRDPRPRDDAATRKLLEGAVVGFEREERVHVAIGPDGTAEDGKLFAVEGLRFAGKRFEPSTPVELELLIDVDVRDSSLGAVAPGLRPLGGKRRLTRWRDSGPALPALPDWLDAHVANGETSVVRVLLLTPAYVECSLGPRMLERSGVAEMLAAKVDRPRVISGWDLASGPPGGQPKKTKRLAESGSVYWVRLSGSVDKRRQWLADVWMKNISDNEQLARDGFGLAAIGIGREP